MTPTEFGRWATSHQTLFPGVGDWRRSLDATQAQDVARAWLAALGDATVEECTSASRRLLADGGHPERWHYHDIPRTVRKLVVDGRRAESQARRDAERADRLRAGATEVSYRCSQCRDQGAVMVIAQATAMAVADGKLVVAEARRERTELLDWLDAVRADRPDRESQPGAYMAWMAAHPQPQIPTLSRIRAEAVACSACQLGRSAARNDVNRAGLVPRISADIAWDGTWSGLTDSLLLDLEDLGRRLCDAKYPRPTAEFAAWNAAGSSY